MTHIIFLTIGTIASNFLYQAFGAYLWAVALERSYFQLVFAVALVIVMMANNLELRKRDDHTS